MHRPDIESGPFSAGIQQNDIPVPLSFQFDKDRSYALITYNSGVGSFRHWTGYYFGDQQVGNLIPWYLQQMAVDGWTHKVTFPEKDRRCLTFTKGEETATISLYRDLDTRLDRYLTFVKAEIHPTPIQDLNPEDVVNPVPSPLGPVPSPLGPPEGTLAPSPLGTREDRSARETGKRPAARARAAELRQTGSGASPGVIRRQPSAGTVVPASGRALERRAPPQEEAPAQEERAGGTSPVVTEDPAGENNEESPGDDPSLEGAE